MVFEFVQGFAPSPVEIAGFALVVAALVALLVWFAVRSQRREERRQRDAARRRSEELIEERALTQSDRGLLERLAAYLDQPEHVYLVLQNHTVFNDCAERALADDAVTEGDVSGLRVRLGFGGEPSGAEPESSSEIPTGSGVVIVDNHDRTIRGRVLEPSASAFRVETDKEAPRLTSGSLIEVIHQDGSGVYRFESAVLSSEPGTLQLSHAENLERLQRRRYYRGEVRLPAYVRLAKSDERPERTELIDVGGGGASFYAPDDRYQRGEHVEITFHPDSSEPLHLPARIVRESRRGSVVHVTFEHVRPAARDRIFGFLFRNQSRR
ncbi:MAG: flagellar brake protein [Spirochaetota bacterium]